MAVASTRTIHRHEEIPEEKEDDQEQQQEQRPWKEIPEWLLRCKCEHPKTLVTLLQSLHVGVSYSGGGGNNGGGILPSTQTGSRLFQPTTVFATPGVGLTIHAHPNPQFQSTLELPASLFAEFQVATTTSTLTSTTTTTTTSSVEFCVAWKSLLDCLGVLTLENPSSVSLNYHGPSEILRVETQQGGTGWSSAALSGLVPPDKTAEISAGFAGHPITARWLCGSDRLYDWTELDHVPGASTITVAFWPASRKRSSSSSSSSTPRLDLSVVGHSSRCLVSLPGSSIDFPQEEEEEEGGDHSTTTPPPPLKAIQHSYPYAAWKRAMKPLELATETCLSVNREGILAIQHQLLLADCEEAAFCDCLLLPLLDPPPPFWENDNEPMENDDDETLTRNGPRTLASATTTASTYRSLPHQANKEPDDDEEEEEDVSWKSQPPPPGSERRGSPATFQEPDSLTNRPSGHGLHEEDDQIDIEASSETASQSVVLPRRPLRFGGSHDHANHDDDNEEPEESELLLLSSSPGEPAPRPLASSEESLASSRPPPTNNPRQRRRQRRRSLELLQPSAPEDDSFPTSEESMPPHVGEDDHDDDRQYCSSPEVVYGED